MNRKTILIASAVGVALIAVYYFTIAPSADKGGITVAVQEGEFIVDITTTGELEAKNSVDILGPQGTRNFRIWNMTIQDILDEGTVVQKGDYVASIDPSELTGNMKDAQLDLEKIESQFIQTKLDTTLEMRQQRDELINLAYGVDEKQLILDQSRYEPPATIRQAEIDLEKAKRALQQAQENYKIKKQQNAAKMQEVSLNRQKAANSVDGMMELMKNFQIMAPEGGMLIYRKDWDGRPIKKGSQISAWDPVVATLPDLSTMLSITYINEVDIRTVKPGQEVKIGLDAFPDKEFNGKVLQVANVGEQKPNSDAKVFKVTIEVIEKDELLRPSMTTSNKIITEKIPDALYIPLECLFNKDDSITYVYRKRGITTEKQEVMLGPANRNEVVITAGLVKDDVVYLVSPEGMESKGVNLLEEMNGKRGKKDENIPDSTQMEVEMPEAADELVKNISPPAR
jgi:multidrug efflux pump subunit AcrA (membrane-fusion protein)